MDSLINIGIIITYIMIGFAALSAILFGVKNILANTKNAQKTLYTILGLVIICGVSYLYSRNIINNQLDTSIVMNAYKKYKVSTEGIWASAKLVGMGLMTFFILFILALGAILYSELSKVFSK